jgi:hypothetical protein
MRTSAWNVGQKQDAQVGDRQKRESIGLENKRERLERAKRKG